MTVAPLQNFLLVRLDPEPETSGLIVTPASDNPAKWCEVLDVGPDVRDTQAGDHLLISTNQVHWVDDLGLIPETACLLRRP